MFPHMVLTACLGCLRPWGLPDHLMGRQVRKEKRLHTENLCWAIEMTIPQFCQHLALWEHRINSWKYRTHLLDERKGHFQHLSIPHCPLTTQLLLAPHSRNIFKELPVDTRCLSCLPLHYVSHWDSEQLCCCGTVLSKDNNELHAGQPWVLISVSLTW